MRLAENRLSRSRKPPVIRFGRGERLIGLGVRPAGNRLRGPVRRILQLLRRLILQKRRKPADAYRKNDQQRRNHPHGNDFPTIPAPLPHLIGNVDRLFERRFPIALRLLLPHVHH